MVLMKAVAFAPGHISGFFEPFYHPASLQRSGSRGAGVSVSLGATSEVVVKPATVQCIDVCINGKKSSAPVTRFALQSLLQDALVSVSVNTCLDLPVAQGFGMSAAGALSASLALTSILKIPRAEALTAAHCAEVQLRTGLGDVIASSFGGIEIRRQPGLPPWGMIEHIPGKYDVVLCVIGKKMETKKVLSDTKKLEDITQEGKYCVKKLLERPSIEQLFSLSQHFTKKIGLADPKVLEAIDAVRYQGMASMCMLGNSVFAVGSISQLKHILSLFGKTVVCTVDVYGARLF